MTSKEDNRDFGDAGQDKRDMAKLVGTIRDSKDGSGDDDDDDADDGIMTGSIAIGISEMAHRSHSEKEEVSPTNARALQEELDPDDKVPYERPPAGTMDEDKAHEFPVGAMAILNFYREHEQLTSSIDNKNSCTACPNDSDEISTRGHRIDIHQTHPGAYAIGGIGVVETALEEGQANFPTESQEEQQEIASTVTSLASPGLAVANPVDEDELLPHNLPQAQEIQGAGAEVEVARKHKQRRRTLKFLCFLVLGLSSFVTVATLLLVGGESNASNAERDASISTQPPSSTMSMQEYVLQLLPSYTTRSIEKAETTPQAKAFVWLLDDPSLRGYPDWRVLQRFALATFYFATGGENWYNSTNWLDYDHHECSWFAKENCTNDARLCPPSPYPNPCMAEDVNNPRSGTYKYLWQWNNGLEGSLPPELFWLTSLIGTSLNNNILEGSIPSTIGLLTQMTAFTIGRGGLTGSIPTEIGLMTNMKVWVSARNDMTGTIPTEVGLLSNNLFRMHLDANRHTGIIPTEMGRLSAMQDMQIYDNRLNSTISSEFGILSNLTILDMSRNRLSGWIPTELGQLKRLKVLKLQENQLSGFVPSELGDLAAVAQTPPSSINTNFSSSGLMVLNLITNPLLSGIIPEELCPPLLSNKNNSSTNSSNSTVVVFGCTPLLCGCACPCSAP